MAFSHARYEIVSSLGRGGMGEVFVARDTLLGRRVALKVLSSERDSDANKSASVLLREARLGAALKHPNIVTVHDLGEANGVAFIVMELVEGESLRSLMTPASLARVPMDEKYKWLAEVADALVAAHEQGIIHRDVKPENVMITKAGSAKVLDFGIAKAHSAEAVPDLGAQGNVRASLTMSSVMGTPRYMAPERWGGIADARSDQYAWGVMAFELLSGEHPLGKRGQPRTDRGRLTDFGVSPLISEAIEVAMASDPIGRHASLAGVVQLLRGTKPLELPSGAAAATAETMSSSPPPAAKGFAPYGTLRTEDVAATLDHDDAPTREMTASAELRARRGRASRLREWWLLGGLGVVALGAASVAYSARGKPTASAEPDRTVPSGAFAVSAIASVVPPPPSVAAPLPSASASASASAAPTARPAPSPEPRRPLRPSPIRATCKIPYTVNSAGIHIPKPECL